MMPVRLTGRHFALFLVHCILQVGVNGNEPINLAYHKSAYYCDTKLDLKIVDGVTDQSKSVNLVEPCPNHNSSFIHLYLEELYAIQFVIVHPGTENLDRLDFFTVYLKESGYVALCAEFPRMATEGEMRVNCEPSPKIFSEVQIVSKKNEGFDIAEIEVFVYETSINGHPLVHIGCFRKFGEVPFESSWDGCLFRCLKEGYTLAGMKNNRYCNCDSNVNFIEQLKVLDSVCDIKCDDGQKYCGGLIDFSVYMIVITLPHYKGCYLYSLVSKTHITSITLKKCFKICDKYRLAIVKDEDCECTDEANLDQRVSSSNCHSECVGDATESCGSGRHASVYGTCYFGRGKPLECRKLIFCENEPNNFGKCITPMSKLCQNGYDGESCMNKKVNISKTIKKKKYLEKYADSEISFLSGFLEIIEKYSPFLFPWFSIALFGSLLWCAVPFKSSDEITMASVPRSDINRKLQGTTASPDSSDVGTPTISTGSRDASKKTDKKADRK